MRRLNSLLIITAMSGLLMPAADARAGGIVELPAVADAFVSGANPNNNYGAAGGLAVSAAGLPRGEFQSVLRFNSSAATSLLDAQFGVGQWTIQAVQLQLTATSPNNPIFNASAGGLFSIRWLQSDAWAEGAGSPSVPSMSGITFNSLPGFLTPTDEAVGTFNFGGVVAGSATYPLLAAGAFIADLSSGGDVSLHLLPADSSVSMVVHSRNFGDSNARPRLLLSVVPEPGVLSLILPIFVLIVRRGTRHTPVHAISRSNRH